MKTIAISSEGPSLDDLVDPRFGRAAGFVIVHPETMQARYVDNGATQAMAQGAGIQSAETVANEGVHAVLTGIVGPKATAALQRAGIQIYEGLEGKSIREAVALYTSGALHPAR